MAISQDFAAIQENRAASPHTFGVGARFTISVMADDFVAVILQALQTADKGSLRIQTTDVSTWISGEEHEMLRYFSSVCAAVAATGKHASVAVHLSRGCPGEVSCSTEASVGPRTVAVPEEITPSGQFVSADWTLYPLGAAQLNASENDRYMSKIYEAIEYSKYIGTFAGPQNYSTRLEGDASKVLATIFAGWILVGQAVQHVTTHATISINSPSHSAQSGTETADTVTANTGTANMSANDSYGAGTSPIESIEPTSSSPQAGASA